MSEALEAAGDELGCSNEDIENEISELQKKLDQAQWRLRARNGRTVGHAHHDELTEPRAPLDNSNHFLLLLSDSALPLGSFAFSSGLESYLAHTRGSSSFSAFLPISVSSYASTTLPFLLAAHRDPAAVADLDDALDAAIICTVGRRASIAQGRALLGIWERSFTASVPLAAAEALRPYSTLLRSGSNHASAEGLGSGRDVVPPVSAHLAPLFGAIARLVGLSLEQTAYIFMFSHVKALISAAVRASMFGPYQAQKTLASPEVQGMITAMIDREWKTPVEEAGQSVPVIDLWIGRHEVLYSRIFNS